MLFESPWPPDGRNLIFNNPYLQVSLLTYRANTDVQRAICDLDIGVHVRIGYDFRTYCQTARQRTVLHSESGRQRCRRRYDGVCILGEWSIDFSAEQ